MPVSSCPRDLPAELTVELRLPGVALHAQQESVFLPERSVAVEALAFCEWQTETGGWKYTPRVYLQSALIPACTLSPAAADTAAFQLMSSLTHIVTADALSAVLNSLDAQGLFESPCDDLESWLQRLVDKRCLFATEVVLTPGDFAASEAFDTLAGPPAGRGRGRGEGGGASAVPGPADLRFLHHTTLAGCHLPAVSTALPLLALATLSRLLGPTHTRALRADPSGRAVIAAELLRRALAARVGLAAPPDGLLARRLPEYLLEIRLPEEIRCGELGQAAVEQELIDSIAFAGADDSEATRIVCRRLGYASRVRPTLGSLVQACRDPQQVGAVVVRLAYAFLPKRVSDSPFHTRLATLEQCLRDRRSTIDHELAAGRPVDEIVDALVAAHLESGESLGGAGAGGSTEGGGAGGEPVTSIKEAALSRALHSEMFVRLAAEVSAMPDTESAEAKVEIIGRVLASGSMVAVRYLVTLSATLRDRHPLFGVLEQASTERLAYFARCQAINPETGEVPALLATWEWEADQLRLLLQGKFEQIQWCSHVTGWIALDNLSRPVTVNPVPTAQWFVVPAVVRGMRSFGQRTMVGLGYDADPEEGFSFASLMDHQLEFLEFAERFAGEEKARLLEIGADRLTRALAKAGQLFLAQLLAAEPKDAALSAFLPSGSLYERELASRRRVMEPMIELRLAFPNLMSQASASLDLPGVVPAGLAPSRQADGGRGGGKSSALPAAVDTRKRQADSDSPGAKSHLAVWLEPGRALMIAGRVYDVAAIARKYSLQVSARCWPVLLSSKPGDSALALCPHADAADHQGLAGAAHKKPGGWNLPHITQTCSRAATAAERKQAILPPGKKVK